MKILQVTYKLPFPQHDGGAYAVFRSAESILMLDDCELKVLSMSQIKSGEDINCVPANFTRQTNFEAVAVDNRFLFRSAICNLFKKSSYFSSRFANAAFARRLRDLLQSEHFDIVQLEHVYLGQYISVIRAYSNAKIIIRTQNVESQLWESNLKNLPKRQWLRRAYLGIQLPRLRREEIKWLNEADGVMALSDADQKEFIRFGVGCPIAVVPISASIDEGRSPLTPVVYHLGSMDWIPNQLGVMWLLEEVVPLLRPSMGEARIHLAGKNIAQYKSFIQDGLVQIHDHVVCSLDFQRDKGILVVPVLSGGGIRVKIIEAMAMGKVIITTSAGGKGLPIRHGENAIVADRPEDFAEAILKCLRSSDLRSRLGQCAYETFLEHFHIDRVSQRTHSFYKTILSC